MRRPRGAPPGVTPRKKAAKRKSAPTGRAASAAAAATDASSARVADLRPSLDASFHMGEGRSLANLLIQQQQSRTVVTGQPQTLADEPRFRLFLQLFRHKPIEHRCCAAFTQGPPPGCRGDECRHLRPSKDHKRRRTTPERSSNHAAAHRSHGAPQPDHYPPDRRPSGMHAPAHH